MCLYAMEWYARINCEQTVVSFWSGPLNSFDITAVLYCELYGGPQIGTHYVERRERFIQIL